MTTTKAARRFLDPMLAPDSPLHAKLTAFWDSIV